MVRVPDTPRQAALPLLGGGAQSTQSALIGGFSQAAKAGFDFSLGIVLQANANEVNKARADLTTEANALRAKFERDEDPGELAASGAQRFVDEFGQVVEKRTQGLNSAVMRDLQPQIDKIIEPRRVNLTQTSRARFLDQQQQTFVKDILPGLENAIKAAPGGADGTVERLLAQQAKTEALNDQSSIFLPEELDTLARESEERVQNGRIMGFVDAAFEQNSLGPLIFAEETLNDPNQTGRMTDAQLGQRRRDIRIAATFIQRNQRTAQIELEREVVRHTLKRMYVPNHPDGKPTVAELGDIPNLPNSARERWMKVLLAGGQLVDDDIIVARVRGSIVAGTTTNIEQLATWWGRGVNEPGTMGTLEVLLEEQHGPMARSPAATARREFLKTTEQILDKSKTDLDDIKGRQRYNDFFLWSSQLGARLIQQGADPTEVYGVSGPLMKLLGIYQRTLEQEISDALAQMEDPSSALGVGALPFQRRPFIGPPSPFSNTNTGPVPEPLSFTPQDIQRMRSSTVVSPAVGVEEVQLTPEQQSTLSEDEQEALLAEKRDIAKRNALKVQERSAAEMFGTVESLFAPKPVGDLGEIGPREEEVEILAPELEPLGPIQQRRPGETTMEWFNRKQRGGE